MLRPLGVEAISLRRGFRMKRRSFVFGVLVVFLVSLLVGACAPEAEDPEEPLEPGDDDVDERYGGRMIVTAHHEISSLSPHDDGPYEHWVLTALIHDSLVVINHLLEVEPVLAKSYDVSEDGLVWTFHLHEGVKFHDGVELTSKDVKYTHEWRWLDPESRSRHLYHAVDRIETPDDYTVVFYFNEPDARFMRFTATMSIVPAHHHSEIGEDAYTTSPIGTGPFKLKEWRPDEHTILEAFDDHFRGRPFLDEFMSKVVPEASVRAMAIETNEADSSVWTLSIEDNLRLLDDDRFTVYRTQEIPLNLVALNHRLPMFADNRVRQALLYALDRQGIIDDLFFGAATVAINNFSPAVDFYHDPNVKLYPYDPAKAEQLLDDAGWLTGADGVRRKDGEKLSFTMHIVSGAEGARRMAPVMQEHWQSIGVEMEIREAPWATMFTQLREGDMDAGMFNWTHGGWLGEPDATAALHSEGATNFTGWSHERIDELLEKGTREIDPDKRRPIYSEIQKIIAEEVPFLFLYYWDWYQVFTPRIQGLPDDCRMGTRLYQEAWKFWIDE